jgi:hypothetical protein
MIDAYMQAMRATFAGLDAIYAPAGPWAKRRSVINRVIRHHLGRLHHSFDCWEKRLPIAGDFKVATTESGFPIYRMALQIAEDTARAEAALGALPGRGEIIESMIDTILAKQSFPQSEQATMADRLYFEELRSHPAFSAHTPPVTIRYSRNPRSERPFYVVHWATYDGTAHLPMIYIATIEDSSGDVDLPPPPPKGKASKRFRQRPIDGLPNAEVSKRFADFATAHSAYSLSLTSIATALDKDFEHLHPKQLRRVVLGPFYAGGLTRHGERVQAILDHASDTANSWLLTWTIQELHSMEEKPARHGLWGGARAEEVFYINTDDLDCARQGVSALEHHALVPHEAYQAVFAEGRADEIFAGYQCHIVSGDQVLQHV